MALPLLTEHRGTFSAVKVYKATAAASSSKESAECEAELVIEEQIADETGTDETKRRNGKKWKQGIRLVFRQVFLPHGYPASVSTDYMAYQIWDTVQVSQLKSIRSLARTMTAETRVVSVICQLHISSVSVNLEFITTYYVLNHKREAWLSHMPILNNLFLFHISN